MKSHTVYYMFTYHHKTQCSHSEVLFSLMLTLFTSLRLFILYSLTHPPMFDIKVSHLLPIPGLFLFFTPHSLLQLHCYVQGVPALLIIIHPFLIP